MASWLLPFGQQGVTADPATVTWPARKIVWDAGRKLVRVGDGVTVGGVTMAQGVSAILSVAAYGAVGNGIADDTVKVQDAETANPAQLLYGGDKIFKVTGPSITITGGTSDNTGVTALPVGLRLLEGRVEDTRRVNPQDPYNNLFLGRNSGVNNTYIPEIKYSSYEAPQTFWAEGNHNVYLGPQAGELNTSGRRNTVVGSKAFRTATTAYYNVVVGAFAGEVMTTANDNTIVGVQAGGQLVSGAGNAFFGTTAGGRSKGSYNTMLGYLTGAVGDHTSNGCTMSGYRCGFSLTTADDIAGYGRDALVSLTTGVGNSAFGAFALTSVVTGTNNTAAGYQSLRNATSSNNSAFGYRAGYNVTSGASNVFFGADAGFTLSTSGNSTFIGYQAGRLTTAGGNTALGRGAMAVNVAGTQNVVIGDAAGGTLNGGNYNILIGPGADVGSAAHNNSTVIGQNAVSTASNEITLGNTSVTSMRTAGVVNAAYNTAPAAGGNAVLLFGNVAEFGVFMGTGAPTVSAAQGSIYMRRDGSGTGDRMYVNTNGTTGWTAVTTAT
jgi:hypothetical protein